MNCPSNIIHDRHNDNTTHLYIGACRNVVSKLSRHDIINNDIECCFTAIYNKYIIAFVVRCRSPVVGASNSICRNRFIVKFLNYFL